MWKTHLIEHEFKDALTNETVVLRISLSGISSPKEIHSAAKYAWIKAYCNVKGFGRVAEIVGKGKKAIAKLEFLPEWVRGLATTDATAFLEWLRQDLLKGKSLRIFLEVTEFSSDLLTLQVAIIPDSRHIPLLK